MVFCPKVNQEIDTGSCIRQFCFCEAYFKEFPRSLARGKTQPDPNWRKESISQ